MESTPHHIISSKGRIQNKEKENDDMKIESRAIKLKSNFKWLTVNLIRYHLL